MAASAFGDINRPGKHQREWIGSRAPILCGAGASVQAAAQLLAEFGATCLFVTGPEGKAQGIVTDKDFSSKVVARRLPPELPVTRIMSSPVISIAASEPAFRALLLMLAHNSHHVLATEEGAPKGAVSHHDLLLLQSDSPISIVRDIAAKTTVEGLAAAQERIGHMIPLWMREGARASHITRVVAELNDRLLNKILQLAETELGAPPVPYCWVVLGSEGRREQTFKTDQDNGLIYADVAGDQHAVAAAVPISNYVNPSALTTLQKSTLKEAFQTVARTQALVESHFRTADWAQLSSQLG
ncbi:MAG TPA: DUF294 nucleotidyltransferase-like domain-containing protein [Terriglobales bacterium]|nr:DUF294 nucleotidyltransferase-like domain-containing protein [Terriglobales bacterium]